MKFIKEMEKHFAEIDLILYSKEKLEIIEKYIKVPVLDWGGGGGVVKRNHQIQGLNLLRIIGDFKHKHNRF